MFAVRHLAVGGNTASQNIAVSPRPSFGAVTLAVPTLVANGSNTLPTLVSRATTEEGSFGQSVYTYSFTFNSRAVQAGPNVGLYYVSSFKDTSSGYSWELSPGLTNPTDAFYQHQRACHAQVSDIVAAVRAHEIGTPGPSHYTEVQTALASNNPGAVAAPIVSSDPTTSLQNEISAAYQAAVNAGNVEPSTNLPANINYSPYSGCR